MSLPIKPILPKGGISFAKSIEFTRIPVVTSVEPPPADGLLLPGINAKIDPERVKSISNTFTVGYADRIGFRDSMEDKIVICGNFRNKPDEDYYAIFDGHSGKDASAYCADNLHKILEERLNEREQHELDISNCLIQTFKQTHENMKTHKTPEGNFVESGTTSLVAYFKQNDLYVANAGDSRAVLSRNKIPMTVTEDHKPDLEREYKRICSIPGGFVQKSRVQGKLAVARSIGDFKWNPYVSEVPDIYGPFNWKDPQYEFLILACDGLWDVMDEQKACDFVRKCKDPREAAIKLRDWAYNERSKDNLSVIVIWFPGFIPDYEPPPVVQQLLNNRLNNNAQSNDGKSASDNSGDSESESSCEGDDDSSSNYDDESDDEDSESDDSDDNNNTTNEQQTQVQEEESSNKYQRQQILPSVEKEEEQSGGNGLNCIINTIQVEKAVEEDLSDGGNTTMNLTINHKPVVEKEKIVEKVVEKEEEQSGGNGLNCIINTIQVEKAVDQDLSGGVNTTMNFTIKSIPVVEKVEEGLSGGNGTLNFSIKSKLKIPSM